MCGIAGAFGKMGEKLADAVRLADGAQRHRGPDDSGFWRDAEAGVVLAHRRLSVIDLSPLGHQPMIDERTGTVIVLNGEIYNYRDLRKELLRAGHVFHSGSDTEVVLKAYVEWGEACLDRIEGMFAFAVWNPTRRELFLARDPLGQKPLYYCWIADGHGGSALIFASELRSLLATGLVDRKLSPDSVSNYVWNGFVPGPETIMRDIRQLQPGHTLTLESGRYLRPVPVPYWELPAPTGDCTQPAEVEDLMRRVLKEHLATDVPLGVFLSGGIDSSCLAKMAADASGAPIRTFTIGFDDSELDESAAAERIARAIGTDHTNIRLDEAAFLRLMPDAMRSLDQPTFDGLNSFVVSRAVREAGLTVALAGTGGDELFGGYRSFRDVPMANRWGGRMKVVPRPIRKMVGQLAGLPGGGGMRRQSRWGKVRDVMESGGDLLSVYQLAYGLFTREFAQTLLGRGKRIAGSGLSKERFARLSAQVRRESPLAGVSRLELSLFLGDRLLRDTDAASMASSLEIRLPLIDRRVVEAVGRLAPDDRFFPLGRKDFLRTRLLRGLDPALFDSPKRGFVMPFESWCRGPLRPLLEDAFRDAGHIRSIGLDPGPIQQLWQGFLDNRPGLYWSRIWSLYALIDWSKRNGATI